MGSGRENPNSRKMKVRDLLAKRAAPPPKEQLENEDSAKQRKDAECKTCMQVVVETSQKIATRIVLEHGIISLYPQKIILPSHVLENVNRHRLGAHENMLDFVLKVVEDNCQFHKSLAHTLKHFKELPLEVRDIVLGKSWVMNHILDFIYVMVHKQLETFTLKGGESLPLESLALLGNEDVSRFACLWELVVEMHKWQFNTEDLCFLRILVAFDVTFHPSLEETFTRALWCWSRIREVFHPIYFLVEGIRELARESFIVLVAKLNAKKWDPKKFPRIYEFIQLTHKVSEETNESQAPK